MKRLYKSPDKKICGVCAGIADYFNIDPTIVRIIVAELAAFTAIIPAFIIYLIMALVIPQAPDDYYNIYNNTSRRFYKGHEKKISGVCSGISEYFDIDPTLVRLLFVLLFLILGNGLYTYIVLAIVLPNAPDMQAYQQPYNNAQYTNYYDPNQAYNNPNPDNGQGNFSELTNTDNTNNQQ